MDLGGKRLSTVYMRRLCGEPCHRSLLKRDGRGEMRLKSAGRTGREGEPAAVSRRRVPGKW